MGLKKKKRINEPVALCVVEELKDLKAKGARLITISCDGDSVFYHLSYDGQIKTLSRSAEGVQSVCGTFRNAELYEREIMEKRGVEFKNHPKPVKLFT